jgi:Rod binding domain-containing protein
MGDPLIALSPLESAQRPDPRASELEARQLREAAVEFESLLMNMMVKSMRSSVPESDLFGDQSHVRMYEEMRDTELSKVMAHQGGLGLAEMIVQQFAGREGEGVNALQTAGRDARAAEASYRANSHLADTGIVPLKSPNEELPR